MYKTHNKTFQHLEIGLASPKEIRSWAERFLPTGEVVGEVTSWETVNYKTLKPEPNGLFCQKIFGPIVDYTCACGKKAVKVSSDFCPKCGVERTVARVRRYRMGYLKLSQPVAHTLYSSQKPSPLGLCIHWPNKRLQAVLYGTEFCHLPEIFQYFAPSNNLERYWDNIFQDYSLINSLEINSIELLNKSMIKNRTNLSLTEDFENTFFKQKKPRLFKSVEVLQKNSQDLINLKDNYPKQKVNLGLYIYGVSYDMCWRQIEDIQEYLMYMWEHPQSNDNFIPNYFFTEDVSNNVKKDTPFHNQYYPVQTGAFVFQQIFAHYDLVGLQRQISLQVHELKEILATLKEQSQIISSSERKQVQIEITRLQSLEKKYLRRLQYCRDFYLSKMQPAWMMLSYLPILPPGLRPITSIRGELVVSDLNSLYRKILTRNRRLTNSTRFGIFDTALSGSWSSWCYNLRQVQEAVDSLLKTGKVESGKTTKSLLDALKGKRGRFRQHLLGKRVDYSGRSVIVVGPQLKIYECGLPKQMALELFQPFLIQQLRNKGIAFTTTGAKAIIVERKPIIWTLLREILRNHPILLNRAPTLHRLGIQAFLPKLVDGKAILLHPLVCPAFNADFDGDQMAVHVPLSPAAKAEAFNLVLACNNMLAPSTGQPLLLPTQDMVLGCYYLTIANEKNSIACENLSKPHYYADFNEVLEKYNINTLHTHTPIWVQWTGNVQNCVSEAQSHERDSLCEIRIDLNGNLECFSTDSYKFQNYLNINFQHPKHSQTGFLIRTTPGRIVLYNILLNALLE